jgi:tRNA uridine 5-carbamoylmethylation protein Kti12
MTTLCLVFCDTDKDIARTWCESLEETKESNHFPADLFEDYASRMEYPNQAKRWDQPLFHLRTDEELPLDKILDAISDIKYKPRDPVSTK